MEAYSLDGVRRLEDKGVTDVIVGFRQRPTQADTHAAAAEDRRAARLRRPHHREALNQ